MIPAYPVPDPRSGDPVEADFWFCYKCKRLCTGLEMAIALGPGGSGFACPCGSQRYQPTDIPWWGWFLPRVWKFAYLRIRGRA
jgi:hypothetical protein